MMGLSRTDRALADDRTMCAMPKQMLLANAIFHFLRAALWDRKWVSLLGAAVLY